MVETIIVLAIVGGALAFAARWAYQRMSGKAVSCCSEENGQSSCSSCDSGPDKRSPGEVDG